jgi:hypothetical protein
MNAAVSAESLFARLHTLGAGDFVHLDGSLAAHLHGTERLLRAWGACDEVRTAGLYHAVYGTDGYAPSLASLDQRQRIAELIGVDAERLAYLYGACDRERFHPRIGTPTQLLYSDRFRGSEYEISRMHLAQFCELTLANEIEIAARNAHYRAKHRAELSRLFERMSSMVSQIAIAAGRNVLG